MNFGAGRRTVACTDSARQPQDRHRRGVTPPSAVSGTWRGSSRARPRWRSTPARTSIVDRTDRPARRCSIAGRQPPSDPAVGGPPGQHHRPTLKQQDQALAGVLTGWRPGGRRGTGAVRSPAADAADRAGEPGQHRRGRGHPPTQPRAAAGAVAAGARAVTSATGWPTGTPARGLPRRVPEFPTQPEPAAAMRDWLPARAAEAVPPMSTPRPGARRHYCRIPQDSAFNVRGACNISRRPWGKRAPTVKQCESRRTQPLNDGLTGRRPQRHLVGAGRSDLGPGSDLRGGSGLALPPTAIAAAEYDPGPARTLDPMVRCTPRPIWRRVLKESKHGRRCCCPRR